VSCLSDYWCLQITASSYNWLAPEHNSIEKQLNNQLKKNNVIDLYSKIILFIKIIELERRKNELIKPQEESVLSFYINFNYFVQPIQDHAHSFYFSCFLYDDEPWVSLSDKRTWPMLASYSN